MSSLSGSANASAPPSLKEGTTLGGRFVIESHHEDGVFGPIFRSRDQKTGKSVKIKLLTHGAAEVLEQARTRVKEAAQRKHRNLATIYGVGTHEGSFRYVAQEWVQGVSLSDFVSKKAAANQPVSLRAAYNLVAHICKALATIHPDDHHGALRPDLVWVTKSGRVKITESGLSRAIVETQSWSLLPEPSREFLAPEIVAGQPASAASDIYGIGSILLMLLAGHSPRTESPTACDCHPEASDAVDALISRCLAVDPDARFPSAEALAEAMMPLVLAAPEGDIGLELDVEIDVDVANSLAPPAAPPSPRPQPPVASTGQIDLIDQANLEVPIPTMAKTPPSRQNGGGLPFAPVPAKRSESATDVLALRMEELTQNDSSKWMAVKDGMDHGPFTTRRLIKLILEGELLPEHTLFGMRGNDRKKLADYPQFSPFVEQYQLRKSEANQKAALATSEQREKRAARLKIATMAGGLIALLALTGGYLLTREQQATSAGPGDVDLAGAYDNGQVGIEGTAKLHRQRKRKQRKRASGTVSSKSPGSGSKIGSYSNAMNQAMELGDATKKGGERQLSRPEVAGVMNRHLNSLFGCVSREKRAGGSVGDVRIDMAIRGNGSVMGATVTGGSSAFKSCVVGKVERIKFPTFPSPRMGARYSFDGRQ